jgi:hypothetical protein
MENQIANPHSLYAINPESRRAFVALGLWLRLGTVGAFGLAAGLLELVAGEIEPLSALALALGGGVLLAIGAWRGRAALDQVDDAAVAPPAASSAARAAQVSPASRRPAGHAPRRALIDAVRRVAGIRPEVSS